MPVILSRRSRGARSAEAAVAREGALDKLSPALGAGKTDVVEFRGRGGAHYKVIQQREIL
ncbi:MAG: hypothetical protein JO093_17680 [Acidobacteria bacterium]|nr:hypothetical protein [Acidobacteriota bacterium]MBV9067438.1 hypothetical protein [Acidobacteriota bacterium]MBV9187451.1 hypothetical protein [Acidobacteriota bacterium]